MWSDQLYSHFIHWIILEAEHSFLSSLISFISSFSLTPKVDSPKDMTLLFLIYAVSTVDFSLKHNFCCLTNFNSCPSLFLQLQINCSWDFSGSQRHVVPFALIWRFSSYLSSMYSLISLRPKNKLHMVSVL